MQFLTAAQRNAISMVWNWWEFNVVLNYLVHWFINLSEEYFAAKLCVRRGKAVSWVCLYSGGSLVVVIMLSVVIKWLEETKWRLSFFSYEVLLLFLLKLHFEIKWEELMFQKLSSQFVWLLGKWTDRRSIIITFCSKMDGNWWSRRFVMIALYFLWISDD